MARTSVGRLTVDGFYFRPQALGFVRQPTVFELRFAYGWHRDMPIIREPVTRRYSIKRISPMTQTKVDDQVHSGQRRPSAGHTMARHRQRGTATVEFGLLLPLLVLIVSGIVEFGMALYDKAVLTNASREGARAGIVLRVPAVSNGEISTRVLDYSGNALLTLGAPSPVTVDFPVQANPAHLAVRVSYTFRGMALGNLLSAMGSPLVLTSTTVMVRE